MTYQDDPNLNRRSSHPMTEETSYTGWIIGGAVALAVILGIFLMTSRTDNTNTATNSPNRPAATAPATTGSAVPAPTQTPAPSQNVPPAPAR